MKPGPLRQSGFTVFEAATVVLVAGVIWVVLLQRQGLVERALARTLVAEMQAMQQMVLTYQDRYGAVPGDDTMAAGRFTGAISADSTVAGDGAIQGPDWVGKDGASPADSNDEPSLFWQHVRMAGLAGGERAKFVGHNSAGGLLGISSSNSNMPAAPPGSRSGFHVCSSGIDGPVARMMDADIDDSNGTTGRVWATDEIAGVPVVDYRQATHYQDEKTYTVCMLF